ncbi:glutathione S-transferase U8-like protein [Corchorus olitorius]|uniref:Glutathione S-transferase U8-like protein n=1 Tax=Corchorus olitorius TaxID=93759 RepID=A0A1R3K7G7_9ROSI|nr:glutathione S-transferase U8-like protein [Corchorus olitorius]
MARFWAKFVDEKGGAWREREKAVEEACKLQCCQGKPASQRQTLGILQSSHCGSTN